MKLLIRNLDRSTTEKELKGLFQEFGTVQSCTVVIDRDTGKSKGFGFVEMPKIGDAKAAIKNLNNKIIGSNKIRVKKTEDKKTEEKKTDDENTNDKKVEAEKTTD
ncbi:MAG: RNA-binding protein [Alcanivoracaceae bacterium]|nr:RNA-binding protein [Alcanivoracaceae bacterium]